MAAPGTKIFIYGNIGYEQELDSHIKTRVMFAIADEKKTRLAWYLFSQAMLVQAWENKFDIATLSGRKLDRNEPFGAAGPTNPMPFQCDFRFKVGKLAPLIVRSPGEYATLDMDDDAAGTTSCLVYIDVKPNGVILQFDLKTVSKRRTLDITKKGRVYLLGVEKFSLHAISRGPTKALTPTMDPSDPML